MVQAANTETDKAVDALREATAKILPAKQTLAIAPNIEKATVDVSNTASDFLAIFQRNLEAFAKAQQAIMNGNKAVLDKKIDMFKSNFEHGVKSLQDIIIEQNPKIKLQKIFDAVRSNMQDSTGSNNIVAEVNARFNAEVAQIMQTRTSEMLDEVQALFERILDASPMISRSRDL